LDFNYREPVLLFRYSALTFNAHRIHYDLPYASETEGYAGLVVKGGLTALLLIETARVHLPLAIVGYTARAVKPLFAGRPVTLAGRRRESGAELVASISDGRVAFRMTLTVAGQ
jgi:3-methylfumaryl-CoA hydratase